MNILLFLLDFLQRYLKRVLQGYVNLNYSMQLLNFYGKQDHAKNPKEKLSNYSMYLQKMV